MNKKIKRTLIETVKALVTAITAIFMTIGWYHIDEYLPIVPTVKTFGFIAIFISASMLMWHFIVQVIKISRETPNIYKH